MGNRFINFVLTRPKLSLSLSLILILLFLPGLRNLEDDYHMRYWLAHDDPATEKLDRFNQHFGNDEALVIAFHNDIKLFTPHNISLIAEFKNEFEQLENVQRIVSLFNYPLVNFQNNKVSVKSILASRKINDQTYLNASLKQAQQDELTSQFLISKDGNTFLLYGFLKPDLKFFESVLERTNYKTLIENVQKLILKYQKKSNTKIFLTGPANIQYQFLEKTRADVSLILPLILLIIIISLSYFFKDFLGVLLPLIIVFGTILIAFGLAGYLNMKIENMLSVVPLILITICIADTVHILHFYYYELSLGNEIRVALTKALNKNWMTTFLTSLSTAIGFTSLTFSKLVPIYNLGLVTAFGTIIAWILSFTLLPSLIILFGQKQHNIRRNTKIFTNNINFLNLNTIKKFIEKLNNHRIPILWGALFIGILGISVGSFNEVNSEPLKWFKPTSEVRKNAEFVINRLGGVNGPEIIAHSGSNKYVVKPSFLKKVAALETWLESTPGIVKVISPIKVIKKLNRLKHENRAEFYKIPNTEEEIIDLLFGYKDELSKSSNIGDFITQDFEGMRLSLLWNLNSSKHGTLAMQKIKAKAKELNLSIDITGKSAFYLAMNGYVVSTYFQSLAWALLLIALLLAWVLRSIPMGIIALIPNLIPLSLGLLLMKIFNISIDMGTAIICSVCLGIAVDDTIHIIFHFNKYMQETNNIKESLEKVIFTTGKALIITTLILVMGFSMFGLGSLIPNINFGILTAIMMALALITDLTLLPVLLLTFAPLFLKNKSKRVKVEL